MSRKTLNVSKITLIGCGNIGKYLANAIFLQDSKIYTSQTRELHLIDLNEKATNGVALKLNNSRAGLLKNSIEVTSGGKLSEQCIDYSSIAGSDIIVVTAGKPRTPDMKREDLIGVNAKVISDIAQNIKCNAPNALVIVVTNPLDQMTFLMSHILGPSQKVLGMTCIDENRFINTVYEHRKAILEDKKLNSSMSLSRNVISEIRAKVIGSHSDKMMIDWESLKYGKNPIAIDATLKEKIANITINSGKTLNELCGHSDDMGTANSILGMMISLVNGKWVTSCTSLVEFHHFFENCFLGFPVRIEGEGKIQINVKYFNHMSMEFRKKFYESAEFTKQENQKLLEMLEKEKISTPVS